MRVAVVGGGIAGLAAAWELRGRAQVTVYEPDRLGGRILTEPFAGRPVEAGPDAFITRRPEGLELCVELGLDGLIAPAAGRSLLWWGGKLRELPGGLMLGIPRGLASLATSGILSPAGLVRAAGDLVLPRTPVPSDLSVHELIATRFGAQVADRLVDPLIGSIHAATTERLSAETTVPQIVQVARRSRSLMAGLRRLPGGGDTGPIFATHPLGLGHVVDRLVERLTGDGVGFETARVEQVVADGRGWALEPMGGCVDAVVVATAAPVAARLLGPDAPAELAGIGSTSVAVVTLSARDLPLPEGVNGFLVPRSSGLLMTACSFASSKWPHWASPGHTVLRVSTGRAGDDRFEGLSDEQLVDRLREELSSALGTEVTPDLWRVHRWPAALPLYEVGHLQRIGRIRELLERSHPRVVLCGSSYEGAGIPACIASGRTAARSLVDSWMEAA